ncbi:hypothetical protein [Clostridium thailandense]|uniref:hypothetical protein n=1 Tax=Clostridium thailandense TaxID=2794346 RepID=UPI003989BC2A
MNNRNYNMEVGNYASSYTVQLDYLLRPFFATICRVLIGIECENRMKDASIRTHVINVIEF